MFGCGLGVGLSLFYCVKKAQNFFRASSPGLRHREFTVSHFLTTRQFRARFNGRTGVFIWTFHIVPSLSAKFRNNSENKILQVFIYSFWVQNIFPKGCDILPSSFLPFTSLYVPFDFRSSLRIIIYALISPLSHCNPLLSSASINTFGRYLLEVASWKPAKLAQHWWPYIDHKWSAISYITNREQQCQPVTWLTWNVTGPVSILLLSINLAMTPFVQSVLILWLPSTIALLNYSALCDTVTQHLHPTLHTCQLWCRISRRKSVSQVLITCVKAEYFVLDLLQSFDFVAVNFEYYVPSARTLF
jgi:hypothetical protein